MSSYITKNYNRFIDESETIYNILTGNSMNDYENKLLDCGDEYIDIGPMQFLRIVQYRRTGAAENDYSVIKSAMTSNLEYCYSRNSACGFFIVSVNDTVSVYLGIENESTERFEKQLSVNIPDVAFESGFVPQAVLGRVSSFGGIISGDLSFDGFMLDSVIAGMKGYDCFISVLAFPMNDPEASSYLDALYEIKQTSAFLLNNDMSYTHQTRNTAHRNYPFVSEIDACVEKMIKYYSDTDTGFWKSCIWFGCGNEKDSDRIGSAIAASLNSANKNKTVRARKFFTTFNPFSAGHLFIPEALYGDVSFGENEALLKPSLLSYVSTDHLSGLFQLPSKSVKGFKVIRLEKREEDADLFDMYQSVTEDSVIYLGHIHHTDLPFALKPNDISEHVLITGATGAGKTNTLKKLIQRIVHGIGRSKIPFLIIEPSKKDYWCLATDISELKVYSYGKDAELLCLNPMIPEEGTIIGNHIDSLLYAFSGAFEMEEPTRLALDGLLKYVYLSYGWDISDIVYYSGKRFPKIKDLVSMLYEYCNTSLPYGEEVKNNIIGSLFNRLSSLNSGIVGMSANSEVSISGKELCSGSILIELDDLSLDMKPFVAMLIMIKVDQYLRQSDNVSQLNNVVVLEEAHNIFPDVSGRVNTRVSQIKASEFFGNMLSQIREYGTGIIIADQGASQISSAAVSNTKIKIIHGVTEREDIEKVSFALNLSDIQKKVFPTLSSGEAVIGIRGEQEVCHVDIDYYSPPSLKNIACVFCKKKNRCKYFNNTDTMQDVLSPLYAQRIYMNRLSSAKVRDELLSIASYVKCPEGQELCLLGYLLSDPTLRCGEREKRRIVISYLKAGEQ